MTGFGVFCAVIGFIVVLVLAVGGLISIVSRLADGHWPWQDEADKGADPLEDAVYDVIVESLRSSPAEWVSDGHSLTNAKRRVSIWVANEAYGLGITLDGTAAMRSSGELPRRLRKRLWDATRATVMADIVERFRKEAA